MRFAVSLAAATASLTGTVACGLPISGDGPSGDAGDDGIADGNPPRDATITDGPTSDGPPSDAATCDADLTRDPAHCGRCDRDCAGGICDAGACSPVTLLGSPQPIRAMGITDTYVVWVTSGASGIYRALLDGGDPQLLETVPAAVAELTTAQDRIFYTTGDLHAVSLDGGGDTILVYGNVNACLQVTGSVAYAVNGGNPPSVDAIDLDSGTRTPLVPQQDLVRPWGVAVTATNVYWSGNQHGTPDGGLWQLALDGGAASEIVPHLANPNCITVFGSALYWPNFDDGTVMTSDLAGGAVQVLAAGQDLVNPPTTVTVDSRFVYWHSGSNILRLAR